METKLKTLLLQCYQLSLIDEKLQSGITDDTISANFGKSLKNEMAKLQKIICMTVYEQGNVLKFDLALLGTFCVA